MNLSKEARDAIAVLLVRLDKRIVEAAANDLFARQRGDTDVASFYRGKARAYQHVVNWIREELAKPTITTQRG